MVSGLCVQFNSHSRQEQKKEEQYHKAGTIQEPPSLKIKASAQTHTLELIVVVLNHSESGCRRCRRCRQRSLCDVNTRFYSFQARIFQFFGVFFWKKSFFSMPQKEKNYPTTRRSHSVWRSSGGCITSSNFVVPVQCMDAHRPTRLSTVLISSGRCLENCRKEKKN